MPFINEKISEADRVKYNVNALNWGNGNLFPSWMADHERDAFIVQAGGGNEGHWCIWLIYQGQTTLAVSKRVYVEGKGGEYQVSAITIPDEQIKDVEKIKSLLKEGTEESRSEFGSQVVFQDDLTVTLLSQSRNKGGLDRV